MQYMKRDTADLQSGNTTYVMQHFGTGVKFFAYTGDTALGVDKNGLRHNAQIRGYFLRKGFIDAIKEADPNVVTPVYKDNDDNPVFPASKDEAMALIYDDKINISGFQFNPKATEEQKEEAFGKIVNAFVDASKNEDLTSTKNLFLIQANFSEVYYNHGGSENVKISGVDVQEKLNLRTQEVMTHKMLRQKLMAFKQIGG